MQLGVRLRRSSALRVSIAALAILAAVVPPLARAVDTAVVRSDATASPSNIVIGFVGGFVGHDNSHHGAVQFAQRIQQAVPKDTYIRVFENRRRKQAYSEVLRLLDTNHDGVLSPMKNLALTSSSSATVGEHPQLCFWRVISGAGIYLFY